MIGAGTTGAPMRGGLLWRVLAAMAAAGAIALPMLGRPGLADTEGHRVIPAWSMLEHDRWFVPELFGQPYLRKPPGVLWAMACSAAVFGQSEWSARLVAAVSAMGMAATATLFAARWFGTRWALCAGLAQALLPWFWASSRAAELEATHTFAVQLAALGSLDLLLPRRAARGTSVAAVAALVAVALVGMTLAKGPAGLPAIGGAMVGAALVCRSWRVLVRPAWWAAVAVAAGAVVALGLVVLRHVSRSTEAPVLQGVDEFLWRRDRLAGVLLLAPTALVMALPASLALVMPMGMAANRQARTAGDRRALQHARALGVSTLASLGLFTALGVSNPRYAMPAAVFVPPMVSYVYRGWIGGRFEGSAQRWARGIGLGGAWVWVAVLAMAAGVYVPWSVMAREARSGREAGTALAAVLADGDVVMADGLVEARPEVLLYAQRAAAVQGRRVEMRWVPAAGQVSLPPPGTVLLLREDGLLDERSRYERAGLAARLQPLHTGHVHKYDFTAWRVLPPP